MSKLLSGELLFSTARLQCRRWLPSDLQSIFEVYGDPEGARWVGDGQPITLEESERWLAVTESNYRTKGYGMFALVRPGETRPVGFIGLVHPDGQSAAEVKYAFRRETWGEGLASEVVPELLRYARQTHRIPRVIATVYAENLASQRVLVKSGLSFQTCFLEDDNATTFVYGITLN